MRKTANDGHLDRSLKHNLSLGRVRRAYLQGARFSTATCAANSVFELGSGVPQWFALPTSI